MFKKLWFIIPFFVLLVVTRVAHATSQNLSGKPIMTSPQKWAIFSLLSSKVKSYTKDIIASPMGNSTPKEANPELEYWLDKLGEMENCPTTGMVDSNGKKSYGKFCFQKDTFLGTVKKYREEYNLLPYAEEQEFFNWIADEQFQRELVKIIIKEEKDLVGGKPRYSYHWYTTIWKRGLGPTSIE